MTEGTIRVSVAATRSALVRVVTEVYDRGADIQELRYTKADEGRAEITCSTAGGGANLELHLSNLVGVLDVTRDEA